MDDREDLLLRFARIIAADGYGRGLQPVQWHMLTYLAAANRFSRTAKAVTAWLGQTKGSVSQTIAVLEKKGLIARRRDGDDHRIVRLDLTAAGRALLDAPPASAAGTMLAVLPADERAHFMRLVTVMLVGTIARQGGRAFGQCHACRYFEPGGAGGHHCAALDVALTDEDSRHICYEQVAA